ncbi:MAG: hypothetical protein HKN04_12270, partial [Rhodothermaceae bacterium]|nr:hypothetical protein [Rhodothermaceae bacterium]
MTAPVLPPAASTDDPMPASASSDVQQLLGALQRGETTDDDSGEVLFRHVYAELRALAKQHRRRWRGNPTLNTTALVHEAYLKLKPDRGLDVADRAHFNYVMVRAMRQVLVDQARRDNAQKR